MQIVFRFYIICLANIILQMIYYCTVHSTVVPRSIRDESLPINLEGLEKINKNRTGVVYVFWKKVGGLLRIDVERVQN